MANPLNAKTFDDPMDPYDEVDYVSDFATGEGANPPLLGSGETISSFSVAVSPEAAALGLTIMNTGLYVPSLINTNTAIKIWLQVSAGQQSDPSFDGAGVNLGIVYSITTNNSPPRKRQRTAVVNVAQQ